MTAEIPVCPECDHPRIRSRVARWSYDPTGDPVTHEWYCSACGARFDEPARRPRRSTGGGQELTRRLERTDPEDVLPDGSDMDVK